TANAPATDAAPAAEPSDDFSDSDDSVTAEPSATQAAPIESPAETDGAADVVDDVPAESAPTEAEPPVEAVPETPVPAELGGRAFAESADAASQFDANPFPDLVVDDVGRETKANLANILPSDRPVLLWTYAPH
ncbi:MAG: hypothetical protein AB8G26_01365, partial [Ilumatobacter sp.]